MKKSNAVHLYDKVILKQAVKERKVTQGHVAEKLGMKSNALSANMKRDRMSLDMFMRILNALDYDVAVIDRQTGEPVWIVEEEDDI